VKFGMPTVEATDQTVIIVVQCVTQERTLTMGVLVDQVVEVLSIGATHIEPPPSFGDAAIDASFILGIGKTQGGVVFLLDIGMVLSGQEAAAMLSAA